MSDLQDFLQSMHCSHTTFDELAQMYLDRQAEVERLNQEIENHKAEHDISDTLLFDHKREADRWKTIAERLQRKIEHGCTDASCKLCD